MTEEPKSIKPLELNFTLVARHIALYPYCNEMGNLFGGQLLYWIDSAASIFCRDTTKTHRVVTKTIDKMTFHIPTQLGNTINIYAKVKKIGRTSVIIEVLATKTTHQSPGEVEIATTSMVWVAVDDKGKPFEWDKTGVVEHP